MVEIEYNDNNVRTRHDGKGDGWANEHRVALPNYCLMTDIDMMAGFTAFANNSADSLFAEYSKQGKSFAKSKAAIVSIIDRKASLEWFQHDKNWTQRLVYCTIVKNLRLSQPHGPNFYTFIGSDVPPWVAYEVDTDTGLIIEESKSVISNNDTYLTVYKKLGILDMYRKLNGWLQMELLSNNI